MSESILACPISHSPLIEVDRQYVLDTLGNDICRLSANRTEVCGDAITAKLLIRSDDAGAYPVVDGIPILMAPEMLASADRFPSIETGEDPYREAYEEMDFYNSAAENASSSLESSDAYQVVNRTLSAGLFPSPAWLDATYELSAQADAYEFMAPISNMTALQVGGSGTQAVKFLLAGAREAWLITPMLGEALLARELAEIFGVKDKFRSIVGVAEEMPFRPASFDRVYSQSCIHHTMTSRAFPEVRRVLKLGGKFAAIEPWRAPMYGLGTRIFGKQERVGCRPMDPVRMSPLFSVFSNARVASHGTFSRYFLIALGKLGIHPRTQTMNRIARIDDDLASRVSLRKYGSSVALLAE